MTDKINGNILNLEQSDYFYLTENFISQYRNKQPDWGPIGYVTYKRTYARPVGARNEEFWEGLKRVVEGIYTIQKWHCRRLGLPFNGVKAQASAQTMFKLIWEFKFCPSRGFWGMYLPLLDKVGAAPLYNCGTVSTKDIKTDFSNPFCWLMDFLMLGVGISSDTRGSQKLKIVEPRVSSGLTFMIPDTREGWVELLGLTLDSYAGRGAMPEHIDYSLIRPAGAPLITMGGIAPGPDPLKMLMHEITNMLDSFAGYQLTSQGIVDLCNMIAKCVVSGNIRRSAVLMLGEADDPEFLELKDFNRFPEQNKAYRWASNNSVRHTEGMDYGWLAENADMTGELPGIIFLENAKNHCRMIDPPATFDNNIINTNPCGEIFLEDRELCNILETFPSRHSDYQEYEKTLKFAYLYTKTVTLISTHDMRTNAVMMKNRRIGISQTGVIESFERHGRREHFSWCNAGYNYLRDLDDKYSDWMAIPKSKKITTVKPSGTVSLLPGVTSGIHYPPAEYYYKLMRVGKLNPILKNLEIAGYRIEDLKSDQAKNTVVVYFPIKCNYYSKSDTEVSIWEQLENTAKMQYYWADNSVSVTIKYKPEEMTEIKNALELYENRLKSVSFMPVTDHAYEQPPWMPMTEAEYEVEVSHLKTLRLKRGDHHDQDEKYCTSDTCVI